MTLKQTLISSKISAISHNFHVRTHFFDLFYWKHFSLTFSPLLFMIIDFQLKMNKNWKIRAARKCGKFCWKNQKSKFNKIYEIYEIVCGRFSQKINSKIVQKTTKLPPHSNFMWNKESCRWLEMITKSLHSTSIRSIYNLILFCFFHTLQRVSEIS